jgi:hypothetical protein
MIPASKISTLSQGRFVGAVADNFGEEISQKVFHAEIVVDLAQMKQEEATYEAIPEITSFVDSATEEDRTNEVIQDNYKTIKSDISTMVEKELNRIKRDPTLQHLISTKMASPQ